jgi:RNase H-like domain found in reverse transcriptase
VGAVLSHVIAGEERLVFFTSTTLNAAERGNAQVEREAIKVVVAVKRLHKYLYGRKFTLVPDHQCFQYILSPKKGIPAMAAAKLQRWAVVLSAYTND